MTTWREASTIDSLVGQLRARADLVVVVDAASDDDTARRAVAAGAIVTVLPRRDPIGPALVQAWTVALAHGADVIVQLDAGGSHDPADGCALVRAVEAGADLAVGSRFVTGARYAGRPWRRVLSHLAGTACAMMARVPIHDWTSGYRAFTAEAAEQLRREPYRAAMHGWQIEVLARALRLGLAVREVPIRYQAGRSSAGWRAAAEAYEVWVRELVRQ